MFVERLLQRGVSELHPSDIRDVFALCKLAIYMLARQRRVRGILIDNCFAPLVVFVRGLLGPPIAQITIGIELPPLIIEAMRHFVPDNWAEPVVVNRVVGVSVEE